MFIRKLAVITVAAAFLSQSAFAFDLRSIFQREQVPQTVSLLYTLWHGLRIGTATGFSAGWARYAPENDMNNVWKSAGYGALGGTVFGLGAELLGRPAEGNEILADTGFGGGIGATAGTLVGTIAALLQQKSELVGEDAAWGQLAGASLGFLYGTYRVAAGKYSGQTMEEPRLPFPFPVPNGFNLTPGTRGVRLTYEKHF